MQQPVGKSIQAPCLPLIHQTLKRFQVPGHWKVSGLLTFYRQPQADMETYLGWPRDMETSNSINFLDWLLG